MLFVEAFRQDGDASAHARRCTSFCRAVTEPVLCQAFPRPDPRAPADAIYGRAERLLQAHPERHPFRHVSVAMLLTRSPAR